MPEALAQVFGHRRTRHQRPFKSTQFKDICSSLSFTFCVSYPFKQSVELVCPFPKLAVQCILTRLSLQLGAVPSLLSLKAQGNFLGDKDTWSIRQDRRACSRPTLNFCRLEQAWLRGPSSCAAGSKHQLAGQRQAASPLIWRLIPSMQETELGQTWLAEHVGHTPH